MRRKICFKCGVEKEIDEFYAHSKMKDGHLNKCKDCAKFDAKLHRIVHPELVRMSARKRELTKERKAKKALTLIRYRKKYPEKVRARRMVQYALRVGKMIRGSCKFASNECSGAIGAHHEDYSKPLDVIWVCEYHHRKLEDRLAHL